MDIIATIAQDWKNFGIYLDFDETGCTLSRIANDCPLNSMDCCTQMMREWLEGTGKQPATWATLIALLRDAEMNDLAEQVETTIVAQRERGGERERCE